MKSLVVGAMLLRTLNAQIVLPGASGTDTAVATEETVAPIIVPGTDAPSEEELLGIRPLILPLLHTEPSFSLPTSTAAAVIAQATPPSGVNSSPRVGTTLRSGQFGVLDADGVSAATIDTATAIESATGTETLLEALPTDGTVLPTESATDSGTETATYVETETPTGTLTVIETATETVTEVPSETPTDGAVPTDVTPTGQVPDVPTGIAMPIGSNPYVGPYDPFSPYDPNGPYYDPQAQPAGWEGTDAGDYDGEDSPKYAGKPIGGPDYDDEEEECPKWCLKDDSYDSYPSSDSYDEYGEEYPKSDDYDEYSPYKPEPTPDYPAYKEKPEYDPYPQETKYEEEPYPTQTPGYGEEPEYYPEPEPTYPQLKKIRSFFRAVRRQVSSWGGSAYDDDEGQYDGEGGDAPAWIWDLDNAPKKPEPAYKPKPKCPKICYKAKPDGYGYKPARPTLTKTRKGGYQDPYETEQPYQPTDAPYGKGNNTSVEWSTSGTDEPTGTEPVPTEPTGTDEPTGTEPVPTEPTGTEPVPTEPTGTEPIPTEPVPVPTGDAYYDPTTMQTQYYQPAVQTDYYSSDSGSYSSDPGSPAGDYTGDTLDTLCPNVCNPFNPAENFCDITTGCTTTGGSKYYCACRAGFRADNYNEKDFSKQFKVAGQPYVYLAVRTSCNTPCKDQTCSEVMTRDQCK